jgi:hypothetical protein
MRAHAASHGRSSRAALLTGLLLLAGCASVVPVPSGPPATAADAEAAWARVLRQHVAESGEIDFDGIRVDPADLERYVGWIAVSGPVSTPAHFPTREARLAYYINAYNALAMHQVVATPRRPRQRVRFFALSEVRVDGRRSSLYRFETDVIRPLGEPRVHFALNCMVRGCPRLPREPFEAARLEA